MCGWKDGWMVICQSIVQLVIPTLFGNFFGIPFHIEKGNKRVGLYVPFGEESDSSLIIGCLLYVSA